MTDSTKAAEQYGFRARDLGQPKSSNPYPPAHFDLHLAWINGWDEANRSWDSLDTDH